MDRGLLYESMNNYEKALQDFTILIKLDPKNATAYRNRGVMKERLRQSPCSDYKKACELLVEVACEYYEDECD